MNTRFAAEILSIGTELTQGTVLNTNAAYLGKELTKLGFEVRGHSACRDDFRSIEEALRRGLRGTDVLCVSGGLGPTPDDITRDALASFFRVPLRFSSEQFRLIRRFYHKRHKRVPDIVRREAEFPANAQPILNQFGIALGFVIEDRGKVIVVLPGVPGELTRLFEFRIKPLLKKKFRGLKPLSSLVVKTVGLSEPSIMQRLGKSFFKLGDFQFGIYPEVGEVGLRLYADSGFLIRRLKRHARRALRGHIYSFLDESLEAVVGKILVKKRCSISVAESLTGGRVSEIFTRTPGASRYFRGAVVSYHNQVKAGLLNVPEELLHRRGAVSRQTALAMAEGIRSRLKTTLGLAVTGIAGPGGGSRSKPVGLVYLAVSSSQKKAAWEEQFTGDRQQIQARSAKKLLEHLWQWLR